MERWNPEANALFLEAMEIQSPEERRAYVEKACGGELVLIAQVESLLQASERAGGFLEAPAPGVPTAAIREGPGAVLGPYKLLEPIGEGGFGVVFMAEQQHPVRRRVALKVLKPGMDTRQFVARFEAERQALALMDHPNIAHVLDAGETPSGRPYCVMELVRGVPITDYCDQNRLSPHERLGLFVSICQAVQHAHQKGIIHRDLKPSNILVTLHDGTPVVKVIDFGIAKALGQQLTDKTLFTNYAQMIGTPLYMSPEQAQMSGLDVDTRTDIYALGVLLYELMTGTTPLDERKLKQAGYDEIRRLIREEEPPKPSTRISTLGQTAAAVSGLRQSDPRRLSQLFRGELDWIVLKALDKDRKRRYETASAFAADVQRYLDDEPVEACPPSALYRYRKLARRHRTLLVTAAVVTILLGTIAIGSTVATVRLNAELQRTGAAQQAEGDAKKDALDKLWRSHFARARAGRFSRRPGQRLDSLAALEEASRIAREVGASEKDLDALRNEAIACLALPDLRPGRFLPIRVSNSAISFDGPYERYAVLDEQGTIRIHRVADDQAIARLAGFGPGIATVLLLSPDGRFLTASAGAAAKVQVWDVDRGRAIFPEPLPGVTGRLVFTADSRRLLIGHSDGSISLRDLPSGKESQRLRPGLAPYQFAPDPDGRRLAVCFWPRPAPVEFWDLDSGQKTGELPVGMDAPVASLAWSPDGQRLAVGYGMPANNAQVWDVAARQPVATMDGHAQDIGWLAFHPDGGLLASGSDDGTTRLWDAATGRHVLLWPSWAHAAHFSPNGRILGAVVKDDGIQLMEVAAGSEYGTLVGGRGRGREAYHWAGVSPDGRLLAGGMDDGTRLWDLATGRELAFLEIGRTNTAAFLTRPEGTSLLTCGPSGLRRWPIQEDARAQGRLRLGPPRVIPLPITPWFADVSADAQTVAVASEAWGMGVVLDLASEAVRCYLSPHRGLGHIALSPDGRWAATAGWHADEARIWDAHSGEMVKALSMGSFNRATFTADGRTLVTSRSNEYAFWDVGSWEPGRRLHWELHSYPGWVASSSDGRLLALELAPAVIHLIDTGTGRTLARLEDPHGDRAQCVVFTQDNTRLVAVAHYARAIHVWDLRAIQGQLARLGLAADLPPYLPAPETTPRVESVTVASAEPVGPPDLLLEAQACMGRGEFLALCGQYQNAQAEFQRAILLDPGLALRDPQAFYLRGRTFAAAGQWEQALADLTRSIELNPRNPFAWHYRALAEANLGRPEQALADYAQALQRAPEDPATANDFAWLLATCPEPRLRDAKRAVELARKAVALAPKEGSTWNTVGVACYRAGDWRGAIEALRKSEELQAGKQVAYNAFFLAMSYRQQGDATEARVCWDRAIAWMEKQKPSSEELVRFRAEAADLLGIADQ